MKRDIELIRSFLIFFEEKESTEPVGLPPIDGYSEAPVREHLILLDEAGLLRCERVFSKNGRVIYVIPFDLTWDVHEFLHTIRNDALWQKIKDTIGRGGLSLGFEVVSRVATKLVLSQVS